MDEIRKKAKQDYMKGMKYKDICDKYNISMNTLKSWVKRYKWAAERKKRNKKGAHKNKRGAPKGNKNATGNNGGAPPGNLNSIKHGAYQSIYADMLNDEDKSLFEQIEATVDVDEEIKLLRLKIARLLNLEESFFYNMFGEKLNKDISEEERVAGINACMDQLRRLIETKAKALGDSEKLQLEKDKFKFNKYKTEIELQLKKEKLELDKQNSQATSDIEDEVADMLRGLIDDLD